MQINEIKNIVRKDSPIYYRRCYSGDAALEFAGIKKDYKIDFIIELKPTGEKSITITFAQAVDYPIMPIKKGIKELINKLDENGELPE